MRRLSLPLLLFLTFVAASPLDGTFKHRTLSGSKTVIIQMFEWNWDSIASECTNFIGPNGYGFVQVSPPQESIAGPQWWTDYQPVSYELNSKRGNRQQFQNMINACHDAGVGVIADIILNHMAGIDSGTGVGGSSFTHYNYPGIYQIQDFHHCGQPGDDIDNFKDRQQVQNCELGNLADLATGTEYVRSRLAQYGNDLVSLGVDGFRLDAAKHVPTEDISNILGRLSKKVYVTQEVVFGVGQPIQPPDYAGIGDVQEFRYTSALMESFLGTNISNLQTLDNRGWVSGDQANVFVADHDTERNNGSLRYDSPSNTFIAASIFSLAHPYGTPTIISSYTISNNDDGGPNNGTGACNGTSGANGWLCQHRFPAISGMVGFRNAVGSTPMTNWVSPNPHQIAFGRGALGFVAINNMDSVWNSSFTSSLPDGTYCDVVSGGSALAGGNGSCAGSSFMVSGGKFAASVPARNAIAIHIGNSGTDGGGVTSGRGNSTAANLAELPPLRRLQSPGLFGLPLWSYSLLGMGILQLTGWL